jgi:short-subunit dehydrogenase
MKVLITGASSGIGRDMAREFANKSYDLILVARDGKRLNDLKVELNREYKVNIKVVIMDLSIEENCMKLYEENRDIDILVNNAGFGVFGYFDETDLQKELNLIKTNIVAVHILTKLYLQDMVKKDKGRILNVSSIAGSIPGPLMCAYYASKAYVLRLSEGIREELNKKKSNVQISVLQPGPVNTNFNNIAGVKFNLSSKASEYVAKYAINKFLRGKFDIIPGFTIKLAKFFSKITPNFIVAKVCYYMQERKK